MAHDVFISHSAKDKTTADAVCAMLEAEGIRCWIAPRDVTPGLEWGAAIIGAIKQARVMVLVFSANANASPQIRREVERAVNHGVAVLPLRIEDILPDESLEYFIGNVHWLDALTPPLEAHLKSLARTIKTLIAAPEPEKSGAAGAAVPEPEVAAKPKPAGRVAGGASSAGFHFWGVRAWTWAGGAVSALLLAVVFVVIHSNSSSSRPAPSGATPSTPQSAPPPQAAPAQSPQPAGSTVPAGPSSGPAATPTHPPKSSHPNVPPNTSPQTSAASDEAQAQQLMQAKNYQAALPLARKACDEGNPTGCNILGLLYRNGWGVAQNYVLAAPIFQKACNGGEVSGCGNLGYLYVKGLGVPRNIPQGEALLQRACNAGRPWSCNQLKQLQR